MKQVLMAVLILFAGAVVYTQTSISTDGVVESTSGGFKFPDGTVQATAAGAASAPVEDTGQTECWDTDGNSRPCAGTGEDGELQAGVTWPSPRFTDNGDGTVTDNLTGLIWLKDANCPAETKTWQEALDWVKNPLNSGGTACSGYVAGTFTDWRLPNIKELLSLIDYGEFAPALPPGHPFTNVQSSRYWSSTTDVTLKHLAMRVNTIIGWVDSQSKILDNTYVWPVRGGELSYIFLDGFESGDTSAWSNAVP